MKKKRWIILICIIVLLAGIIAGLYYYALLYEQGLKETQNETLDVKHKVDYNTWKKTCEYVNTNFWCGHYDCSKEGYKNNYNLCWKDFRLITK